MMDIKSLVNTYNLDYINELKFVVSVDVNWVDSKTGETRNMESYEDEMFMDKFKYIICDSERYVEIRNKSRFNKFLAQFTFNAKLGKYLFKLLDDFDLIRRFSKIETIVFSYEHTPENDYDYKTIEVVFKTFNINKTFIAFLQQKGIVVEDVADFKDIDYDIALENKASHLASLDVNDLQDYMKKLYNGEE